MSKVFRKSALDRLSSPEQLDQMIVVTPSKFWLVLLAAALLVVVVVVWAFTGSLQEKMTVSGIFISPDEVFQNQSDSENMLICYVSKVDAQALGVGMPVVAQLMKTNAEGKDKLVGKVVQIDQYITPAMEIINTLKDEGIASMLTGGTPVIAVRCTVEGGEFSMLNGLITNVSIITSSRKPISYVFPVSF